MLNENAIVLWDEKGNMIATIVIHEGNDDIKDKILKNVVPRMIKEYEKYNFYIEDVSYEFVKSEIEE